MAQSPGLKIADDAIKELQFGVAELREIRMSLPKQKENEDDVLDQLDPLSSSYKKEPKPKAVSKKYYHIKKQLMAFEKKAREQQRAEQQSLDMYGKRLVEKKLSSISKKSHSKRQMVTKKNVSFHDTSNINMQVAD